MQSLKLIITLITIVMLSNIVAFMSNNVHGNKRFFKKSSIIVRNYTKPILLNEEFKSKVLNELTKQGWVQHTSRDAIQKTFHFSDFIQAFSFMTKIAIHAEKLNHHPEWFNVYNRVDVTLSTHDCNGLSQLDIDLASIMDRESKVPT